MFGELKNVFRLTRIEHSKGRKQNISTSFHGKPVRFLYLRTLDDSNMHLEFFQKKRENDIVNDRMIVSWVKKYI